MYHYAASDLTSKQHYKFLTGSIIPRPIAWVTTKQQDIVNAAPFSYFSIISKEPPLVSLSINRKDTELKDTARNLLAGGEAVIHLVNDDVLQAMNQTAASLPPNESELAMTELEVINSRSIAVPAIAAAPIRMETRMYQHIPVYSPDKVIISDLFLLEVLDYYFQEELFDSVHEYILPEKFQPVARLAGNDYSHLHQVTTLQRPL